MSVVSFIFIIFHLEQTWISFL